MQALIDKCIQHLSNQAQDHHAIVKSHKEDGVLWAVFVADTQNESVHLKKATFLKIATIQSSKAQSLIQMYNTCNHNTQFVCWFTVEDPNSKPLASKVMLVDVSQAVSNNTSFGARARQATAGNRPQHNDPLESLKNDMLSFQQQQQQQQGHSSSTTVANERDAYMKSMGTPNRTGTPGRSRGASGTGRGGAAFPLGADGNAAGGSPTTTTGPQGQYQQILKVSLQVADSVSKMGSTIDELTARMDHMQRQIDARPVHPPGLVDSMQEKIEMLEKRNAALEERIASFDKIQESFFNQVNSLRQFQEHFVNSHLQTGGSLSSEWRSNSSSQHNHNHNGATTGATPRNVIGKPGADPGISGGPEGSLSEEALISNGRFATAVKESQSPRSLNLAEAVAEDDGVGSSVVMGGGAHRLGGGNSGTNSPARTPRATLGGAPRSTSARSGGGESLSSMLAAMESRLSRIKTPK